MRRTLNNKPGQPGGPGDGPSVSRISAQLLVSTPLAVPGSVLLTTPDFSRGRDSTVRCFPATQFGKQE